MAESSVGGGAVVCTLTLRGLLRPSAGELLLGPNGAAAAVRPIATARLLCARRFHAWSQLPASFMRRTMTTVWRTTMYVAYMECWLDSARLVGAGALASGVSCVLLNATSIMKSVFNTN